MFATRALRQAAAHTERTPLIKFIGPRSIPSSVDHSPKPHPASPAGKLPDSYRDHAQQHGPLQKTIRSLNAGIGGSSGSQLGPVEPPKGVYFDISDLPSRFRRTPVELAEIEAIESGGAAMFG
ncbi:ribosomal protein YMR-31 [Ophiocordyceps sinensis CO18]|uniref:Ribosomal protein YMR-31 n=1 Tax=Ophiocordyceps sinensis (strain Co18 / CGMCC 3.14243) TaxID=911162 RepID=T5AAV8_OPHSC|nr:ribosomal protein YMR-31 [Ophiocordyceps sinensis CO18]